MIKKLIMVAAVFSLAAAFAVSGQSESGSRKIGFIDLDRIFRAYPPAAAAVGGLEEQLKEKEAEIEKLLGEIRQMRAESELLAEQTRARKEQEIARKTLQLRQFTEEAEIEINRRLLQTREKMLEEIFARVAVYARENGYDFIFRSEAAAYCDPSLDLTEGIIEALKKD